MLGRCHTPWVTAWEKLGEKGYACSPLVRKLLGFLVMRRTFLHISFVALGTVAFGCHVAGGLHDNTYDLSSGGSSGGGGDVGSGGMGGTGGMGECAAACGPCSYCAPSNMCEPDGTKAGNSCDEVLVGGRCDSVGVCVDGAGVWAKRWGAANTSEATALALVGKDVVMGGHFRAFLQFEGQNDLVNSGAGDDIFLTKINSAGNALAALAWVGSNDVQDNVLASLAASAGGDAVAAGGRFSGDLDLNGSADPPNQTSELQDGMVVKTDGDLGAIWIARIGGGGDDEVNGVALASKGDVMAAGSFEGTVYLSGTRTAVGRDGFVTRHASATGAVQWDYQLGGPGDEVATAIAVDGDGATVVVGAYTMVPTFGVPPLKDAGGGSSIFVAKLNDAGDLLWAKGFGSVSAEQVPTALAIDPLTNDIVVVGRFQGTLVVGADTAANSEAKDDVFIMRLNAAGDGQWVRALSGVGNDRAHSVAVDAGGNVVVAGEFESDLVCDITTLECSGEPDVFVSKYSSNGTHLWAYGDGDVGLDVAHAVLADAVGGVYVAGEIASDLTNFAGLSTSGYAGASDVFLAKLKP